MDMERVVQSRDNWFAAQEVEQEARMQYIQAMDEFIASAQEERVADDSLSERQKSAMRELLASFMDDDEDDEDNTEGEVFVQEAPPEDMATEDDVEVEPAFEDDEEAVDFQPEPAVAAPEENPEPNGLRALQREGRRRNPLAPRG